MRVLLDTNVVIHREANTVHKQEIGILFNWLDRLHAEKCIHPLTLIELERHRDPGVVKAITTKTRAYNTLKTTAALSESVKAFSNSVDRNENDKGDTALLNEVYENRVDVLITEDRAIHRKAASLGIGQRVFSIDGFLEKVTAENPDLADYKVLSVKKEYFGNIDVSEEFFDSFREDYDGFDEWFNRKADEIAYVCRDETSKIAAFLYVKVEDEREFYGDITPQFQPKRRLKIGTFKVVLNGHKLGERFVKIIFDNALAQRIDEIYVTIFDHSLEHLRLIALMEDWGFYRHGSKYTKKGDELVYARDFSATANISEPRATYPYVSNNTRKFIVPIYPEYHTELFPDSILRTESPAEYVENRPNRNAISKVYISRSINRNLEAGDLIVFYRTASGGSAYYTSVVSTIGVVENVVTGITDEDEFVSLCRKRSVFTDDELRRHWRYNRRSRPFIVNFLYVYSLPRRPNRKALMESGVIGTEAPRGFERLSDEAFAKILEISDAEPRFIVN